MMADIVFKGRPVISDRRSKSKDYAFVYGLCLEMKLDEDWLDQ